MMKHLNLEITKSGELKSHVQQATINNSSHLQMLQTSVDRASEIPNKHEQDPITTKRSPTDHDMSSRMAAMAAMFPNLPTSIAATLGFPSSQSKSKSLQCQFQVFIIPVPNLKRTLYNNVMYKGHPGE